MNTTAPQSPPTGLDRRRRKLHDEAVALLRRFDGAAEEERTAILKKVASLLIKLRSLYTTADGLPDWRGVTYPYRQEVRDIYAEAGLPPENNHPVKATLRYHVGNALRTELTEDELAEAGLLANAPRERQAWKYKEGANLAEFAKHLTYRMVRTPKEPADEDTIKHARDLHDMLGKWLRDQDRQRAD